MGKIEVIESLKNTYCRLKPSGIEGVGVFAVRDIPKNMIVFEDKDKWHQLKLSDLKSLDKDVKKMIDDFFVIEADGTVFVPEKGLNGMDTSFYLNNSNEPNVKTIDEGATFVALRKIKRGEELTVSYADYDYKWQKPKN